MVLDNLLCSIFFSMLSLSVGDSRSAICFTTHLILFSTRKNTNRKVRGRKQLRKEERREANLTVAASAFHEKPPTTASLGFAGARPQARSTNPAHSTAPGPQQLRERLWS